MEVVTRRIGTALGVCGVLVYLVFALYPVGWMLLISLKSTSEMFNTGLVFQPTLQNYSAVVLHSPFLRAVGNSLIVSVGAVLIALVVSVPAAYALARFPFRGRESLAFTFLSFRFAPALLIAMPLYIIYQKIGLFDTRWGLIWVYQLIAVPFIIWILRSYFADISEEMEYAGYLDGYSRGQVFVKLVLPLVRPGLMAASLLSFIFCWNAFTFPLVLSGSQVPIDTVISLNYLATTSVHYGELGAVAIISAIPEVVLAIAIRKHLVTGLSFGAIKG